MMYALRPSAPLINLFLTAVLLLTALPVASYGQNGVPSLTAEYNKAPDESGRFRSARAVALEWLKQDSFSTSRIWFEKAWKHAQASGDARTIRDALYMWPHFILESESNPARVLDSLQGVYDQAVSRQDFSGQVCALVLMAEINQNLANFDAAYSELKTLERMLSEQPELPLVTGIRSQVYASLSWHLEYQGDIPGAIVSAEKAIESGEKLGQKNVVKHVKNEMSKMLFRVGKEEEAFALLDELAQQAQADGDDFFLGRVNEMRTNIYIDDKQFDRALISGLASLKSRAPVEMVAYRHAQVARAYLHHHRIDSALYHGFAGLNLAKANGLQKELFDAHDILKEVYAASGNYERALYHYTQYAELQANQRSYESAMRVAKVNEDFEKERQKMKDTLHAEALERQKMIRNIFVVGFGLLSAFSLVIYFQRNRINKERKRSEELLLNILPEEVAEELKAKGEAEAKLIEEVTVLFTDFKGFTVLSETLSPKDLVKDLNECFTAFDQITQKYGLEKIKTIGDSYMAAGGLPTPNTTHAVDAINAALEMRDFISKGKIKKLSEGLPYFEIRIGIHTGPVVAGIVGVKKFQYDIWGDTVNTASRMETGGEAGKVNVSGTTYEKVKDQFAFVHRGKISAKGKGEIDMYFVEKKPIPGGTGVKA